MNSLVHPHLAEAIDWCISSDPDQSQKESFFGEEILDPPDGWEPPLPMALPDFELVVERALQTVGRIWLNLDLRAVTDERRLLVLEYFLNPSNAEFIRPPPEHISINPSGLIKDASLRCYPRPLG